MENSHSRDDYKVIKKHENRGIKFLKVTKLDSKTSDNENVSFNDFSQGDIKNCGLIASIASLSQRPEFFEEIAPQIEQTSEGVKLNFNIYYKGNKKTVTIDDALAFDKNNSLVYARSAQNDNLFLASFFEKAFVKQACNNSYDRGVGTPEQFALTTFSNCMMSKYLWKKEQTKQNIIDCLKLEIDNKSSVVLCITPSLNHDTDKKVECGHCYAVMDYNEKQKAVKLYDPRCHPKYYVSKNKLPSSLTTNADADKRESWVSMDQLENRRIDIFSLHSKKMYKSVIQIKKEIHTSSFDNDNCIILDVCKLVVRKTSTFMVNFSSYTHKNAILYLIVTTADEEKRKVKLKYELPNRVDMGPDDHIYGKGEAKVDYYQRFKLQPNDYIFSLKIRLLEASLKDSHVEFLMKIGSVLECTFENLLTEDETCLQSFKDLHLHKIKPLQEVKDESCSTL